MANSNFKTIVLTGGPCGGKTSAVSILSDLFTNLGWKVFRVPETATTLFSGGIVFPELDNQMQYSLQKSLLTTMLCIENTYRSLAELNAKKGINTILICDRGAMDPKAYMSEELWYKMLAELGLDEVELRDHRYDAIVHLVTAAKGAESFYTLTNNATRTEDTELAKSLDTKLMNAWVGHASFQVIDNINCQDFNDKCNHVVQAISTRLGIKDNASTFGRNIKKRKYLVKSSVKIPVPFKQFVVEHQYLVSNEKDCQSRIRKRIENNSKSCHYTLTQRFQDVGGQKRIETRRILDPREYETMLGQVDLTRTKIVKNRKCFLYKDVYYQLDEYMKPHKGMSLLEVYGHEDDNLVLPDWIDALEVTHDPSYSMYNLSKQTDQDRSRGAEV